MASKRYTIDIAVPSNNLEELIETLRGIGGVESIQFTIDAETKREAVKDLLDTLQDYKATYQGVYMDPEDEDFVREELKMGEARPAVFAR